MPRQRMNKRDSLSAGKIGNSPNVGFDFYSGSKTPEKAIKALDEAANSRVNDDYKLRLRLDGLVYALSFESPEKLKSRIRAIADDSKSVQHVEKFIDNFRPIARKHKVPYALANPH